MVTGQPRQRRAADGAAPRRPVAPPRACMLNSSPRRLLVSLALLLQGRCIGASGSNVSCYSEEVWRNQDPLDLEGVWERCGPDLVCVEGYAECQDFCNLDEECKDYPLRVCDGKSFECVHKDLFASPAGADVGAALVFFFISGLALSAGIGGGGLYVPLLMVLLGFTVKEATGLSQACLSGGASTALAYNLRQRHPSGRKPMIDYNLVLIMGPSLLTGALVGKALNASAPSWLILSLLVVVLSQSAFQALKKAVATWRKEQAGETRGLPAQGDARLSKNPIERCLRAFHLGGKSYAHFDDGAGAAAAGTTGQSTPAPEIGGTVLGRVVTEHSSETANTALDAVAASGSVISSTSTQRSAWDAATHAPKPNSLAAVLDELRALPKDSPGGDVGSSDDASGAASLERSAPALPSIATSSATSAPAVANPPIPQFPLKQLARFVAMWLVMVVSIFARGGPAAHGIVPYCSVWYWLLAALTIGVLMSIGYASALSAIADDSPREEGDMEWTPQTVSKVSRWSLLAGTLAALCGIGGGMVMGPILLDLGFLPQVQSATTATTLFVMSSSTCIAFLVGGVAPVDYAFWLAFFTGVGAVCGKAIIGWVVKRFRRPSIIMFLLAGIICVSVLVMGITGIVDVVDEINSGGSLGFRSFCSESDSDE